MSTNQPQLVQVYNPWQVDSVQAFLSLKCPECVFTSKYEDSFQDHAVKHHPLSAALYGGLIVSVPTVSDVKVEVAPNVIVSEVVEELGKGKRKRKKKFDGQEWRSILPYKCIKCKISFLEENSLKEHIESFHNVVYEGQEIPDKKKNKKIHKCPDCDISYDRIGHLEKHIAAVHDKEKEIKVYLCSMCDSQFKSMAGVTFHMVTEHEGKKPRQCSECNFNSKKNTYDLKKHIDFVHEGIRNFKCELCGKAFFTKINLKIHNDGVHEKKKPWKCELCDVSFHMKNGLKMHTESIHEGKKNFQCKFCEKSFYQKSNLKIHTRNNHEPKKLQQCHLCEEAFPKLGGLRIHIRTVHEKKEPILCFICHKAFTTKKQVARHIRDVHGEKPYSCDHCDVRFRSGYDKKTHMEAVHDKEVPQGCPICAKTFHKKSYVARHIKEVHEKERPFSCDQCGMKCSSRSNLNKHVKRHELAEQKKKTECEFCELKFSSIGALNLHIKKMHYKSVPEDFPKTKIKQESGSTKTRIIMEFNKKGEFSTVVDPKKIKELNAKFDCANSMPTGNVGSGRGTGKVPPIPIANINVLEPLPKETLKEFVKNEEDPLVS